MHHIKDAVMTAVSDAMTQSGVDSDLVTKVLQNFPIKKVMEVTRTSLETAASEMSKKDVKKSKNAPRPPMIAYHIFGRDLRDGKVTVKDLDAKHAGHKSIAELLKKINNKSHKMELSDVSTVWQGVNNEAKARFATLAGEDKARYDKEMESFVPVPEMPKAPHKSAVDLYVKEKLAANRDANRKDLIQEWEGMTPEQQSVYVMRVAQEKLKYRELVAMMKENLTPEQMEQVRRESGVDAPPKPKSAYCFFTIHTRPEVVAEMEAKGQDIDLSTVSKKMSDAWNALTEEGKAQFNEMAKEDKERYAQEMELYQKGQYKSPQAERAERRAVLTSACSLFTKHTKSQWKSEGKYTDKSGKEVQVLAMEAWKALSEEQVQEWVDKVSSLDSLPSPSSSSVASPTVSTVSASAATSVSPVVKVAEKETVSASASSKPAESKKRKVEEKPSTTVEKVVSSSSSSATVSVVEQKSVAEKTEKAVKAAVKAVDAAKKAKLSTTSGKSS